MRYRSFGASDLDASVIGLGVWNLTGRWGEDGPAPVPDDQALRLLRCALDLGVTFFDTADADGGDGRGERLLGHAVRGRRDEVTIATKFGFDVWSPRQFGGRREVVQDWSPGYAGRALDRSLQRLGTEPIDLWQLHHPRMDAIDADELFAFLDEQVVKGKIRHYGVALGPGHAGVDEGVAALRGRGGVVAAQAAYSLAAQDPGRELAAVAVETGTGLVARVPPVPAGLADRLGFLWRDRDQTLAQAALCFVLATDGVTTAVPELAGEEDLAELAAAADLPAPTADDLDRIAELREGGGLRVELSATTNPGGDGR